MLILSLESAGASCSACVWQNGAVLALAEEHMERGQDQRLMPLIVALMKQSAVGFADLDRVAVTRGPGSFTGLRIGLAAARGIGLAASKPVIGLDRFAIFRDQVKTPNLPVMVILESKRKELFCRFYPVQGQAHEPLMLTEEDIAGFLASHGPAIIAGDKKMGGHPLYSATEPTVVTAARLARFADASSEEYQPRPLYLRAPDVTMKAAPLPLESAHEA